MSNTQQTDLKGSLDWNNQDSQEEDLQQKQELLNRYNVNELEMPEVFDLAFIQECSRTYSDSNNLLERAIALRKAERHLIRSHFQTNDGDSFRWTKPENDDIACFVHLKKLPRNLTKLCDGELLKQFYQRSFIISEIRTRGTSRPVEVHPDWRHVNIDVGPRKTDS